MVFIVTFPCSKLGDPKAALLPGMKPTITFKCEKPLPKIFTGEVDLYTVDFLGLDYCDARQGYLLGTLTCGHTKSFKTSELLIKDVETYKILGKCKIQQIDKHCVNFTSYSSKSIYFFMHNLKALRCLASHYDFVII